MRIDDCHAIAGVKVGNDHVAHECCFSDARLAENRRVLPAYGFVYGDDRTVTLFSAEENLHYIIRLTGGIIKYMGTIANTRYVVERFDSSRCERGNDLESC